MDQARHGQRLAAEAGDEALVVGEVLGEDLHRDLTLEDPVGRLVDVRHPAGAEPFTGFVAPREGSGLHQGPPSTEAPGPIPPADPPLPGGVTSISPDSGSTASSSCFSGPLALPLPLDSSPPVGGSGCLASFSAFS